MDNLLLLYILTLLVAVFVGISIVLRIFENFYFTNISYPTVPVITTANNQNTGSNKSSGFGATLLFLIILAALFWLLFSRSQQDEIKSQEPSTPKLEYDTVQQKEKREIPMNTYMVSTKGQTLDKRINQSPTMDEVANQFAIQVVAVSSLASAERVAIEVSSHQPVIIEEDGMYKVVITGFQSLTVAKKYQKYYRIQGFTRTV